MFEKIVFELTEHFCPCKYDEIEECPWTWGFEISRKNRISICLQCKLCSKKFIIEQEEMKASINLLNDYPSFGNKL